MFDLSCRADRGLDYGELVPVLMTLYKNVLLLLSLLWWWWWWWWWCLGDKDYEGNNVYVDVYCHDIENDELGRCGYSGGDEGKMRCKCESLFYCLIGCYYYSCNYEIYVEDEDGNEIDEMILVEVCLVVVLWLMYSGATTYSSHIISECVFFSLFLMF